MNENKAPTYHTHFVLLKALLVLSVYHHTLQYQVSDMF